MKRIRIGSGLSKLLAPLGVALALAAAPAAQAEDDLVLGGSIPLSGVFAFAGQGIHAGITDYVKIVNDQGGIKGRKLRYVPEDTAYKVDASVAAFKKITSQNKVNFYYGDSTGFSKTINAELNRSGNILMTGASFATELNDPAKYPAQFMLGPDYTEMFGILLRYIAKEKPGAKVANTKCAMKEAAMVEIARYSPLTRSEGMPTSSPPSIATTPAPSRFSSTGVPSRSSITATV